MPFIKKDAPAELIETIHQIETRADSCYAQLKILRLQANVTVWALLVGAIDLIEREIATRGDNTFNLDAALLNISRFVPVAMKWAFDYGKPTSKLATRHWTPNLASEVNKALFTAHLYTTYLFCLPMWHKHRYAAESVSPALVRFTALGGDRNRQVSAYQKGFRPTGGNYKAQRAKKTRSDSENAGAVSTSISNLPQKGASGFEYEDPWDLWQELLPEYEARITGIVRRADALSLGSYSMSDFNKFYTALLAVCAAHEFLCFAWQKNYGLYPFNSAVLVWPYRRWGSILSNLSGLSFEKCRDMIGDLTFDFTRSIDLHIHPFVALDPLAMNLALAPQFPLHSRPDENILRVCSILRPDVFDLTSLEKEPEFRKTLHEICGRYSPQGPINLPKPNPDIDLLLSDDSSSTLVIAELKWIRKTTRPVEFIERDAEVLKGINQLGKIRKFLNENPNHLASIGKLPKSMSEYKHIFYVLIARDHWVWVEPEDVAIFEFDVLAAAIKKVR